MSAVAIAKLILTIMKDKKNRDRLVIILIVSIIIFFMIVSIIVYILTAPITAIASALGIESNENNALLQEIENIKSSYSIASIGEITFNGDYCMPIETQSGYTITSEFGYRVHPITGINRLHSGLDIVGKIHGNILSIADGEIIWAGVRGGYGNCINIKHTKADGSIFYSFYAHLSKIDVEQGQKVIQGQIIGLQGGASTDPNPGSSTGSHLHFEIRLSQNGDFQNPRDYIFNKER